MRLEEMTEVDMERYVTSVMLEMGVPAHLKGYHFLRDAIILSVADMEVVSSVTKLLYPTIGRTYATSGSRVERAIRNAIEVSWKRGKAEKFQDVFGFSRESGAHRPTNSEYIARVADQIRLDLRN